VVQSVVSAFRLLEEVAVRQPARVTDLSRALDMPKSSVHRLLTTLCECGWVRLSTGEIPRYVLTSKALVVGRMVSPELGLREAALPTMVWLRDATEETVHLSLRDEDEVLVIERVDSQQSVRTYSPLGSHGDMHTTASGKAMLALLPADELDRFVKAGLRPRTDNTITKPDELLAELATVRRQGYATNRGEHRLGVAAVAAAIKGDDGAPLGALNVTAPASRTSDEALHRFGDMVAEASAQVEKQLWARGRP
jgi:IclR family transcriptional regulator, acetate operon repressor